MDYICLLDAAYLMMITAMNRALPVAIAVYRLHYDIILHKIYPYETKFELSYSLKYSRETWTKQTDGDLAIPESFM